MASTRLGGTILNPYDRGQGGPGGWVILFEPELHLKKDILVPDLAGWRRERMPMVPNVAFFELPPDWICEVASPGTVRLDRMKKLPIYARHEVRWAWMIDPIARLLEVFVLENGRWSLLATHGGEETVRAEPFDGVDIELGWLFGDAPPSRVSEGGAVE